VGCDDPRHIDIDRISDTDAIVIDKFFDILIKLDLGSYTLVDSIKMADKTHRAFWHDEHREQIRQAKERHEWLVRTKQSKLSP
jgi:hypothetical protein